MNIDAGVADLVEEYAAAEFDGQTDLALADLIRSAYSAWKHADQPTITPSKKSKSWRKSIVDALAVRDGSYECRSCGSLSDVCIDHIYPVSLGGTDDLDNLQLLCRNCNSAKGNRIEAE